MKCEEEKPWLQENGLYMRRIRMEIRLERSDGRRRSVRDGRKKNSAGGSCSQRSDAANGKKE